MKLDICLSNIFKIFSPVCPNNNNTNNTMYYTLILKSTIFSKIYTNTLLTVECLLDHFNVHNFR